MPVYEVSIARTFIIKIQAPTAKDASRLSECFLGYADDSNEQERKEFGFEFREIEMLNNDVLEVSEVEV